MRGIRHMKNIETKFIFPENIRSYFDSLNEEEITSEKFLTEFILKRVGVGFRKKDFSIEAGEFLRNKGMKIKVWADELARFLIFLYEHKEHINSYLEFGTGTGGTFYVIDSYLRTINPNMGKSVTLDKKVYKLYHFEEYQKQNINANFYVGTEIRNFEIDQFYDLCFIDANHRYEHAKYDYEKVKDNVKFIVFHDIVLDTGSDKSKKNLYIRHLWNEIKNQYNHHLEIITKDPRISFMSGIGILWN